MIQVLLLSLVIFFAASVAIHFIISKYFNIPFTYFNKTTSINERHTQLKNLSSKGQFIIMLFGILFSISTNLQVQTIGFYIILCALLFPKLIEIYAQYTENKQAQLYILEIVDTVLLVSIILISIKFTSLS